MKKILNFITLFFIVQVGFAQPGANDPTFNNFDDGVFGDGSNFTVRTTTVQPDGKIIIGGSFTSFNGTARNRIARLNADGSLDTTFNPGSGLNNTVNTVILQPDGKIIIGGQFTEFNGTARNRIARLNADGNLDTTFNPGSGANTGVFTTSVQSDGKIIIGGSFTSFNGIVINRIARLNADGTLDASFNPGSGANDSVNTTILQPDGKIIIIGNFTSFNGIVKNRITRLNAVGSLDTTFTGSGANDDVYTAILQPDGKIIIGGFFTAYNGIVKNHITRLNADGSLDTSFNPGSGANSSVFSTAIQSDGKIIIGGFFTSFNGTAINRIARLNPDGSLDASFNNGLGANNTVFATAVQTDGKIIIGGDFSTFNGTGRSNIARLNADSSLDTAFNPGAGANNRLDITILQLDGKIIIGGSFTSFNGTARNYIARLNTDGSLDTSFNPGTGAFGAVSSTALQSDGKIIIGGDFTAFNGTAINRIARLNADGSLDTTFNPGSGTNNFIDTTMLQPDGKIIIGGRFTAFNGTIINHIARLNTDGSLDTSFNPGSGTNNTVFTTILQPDGKIIIGGNFTAFNGTARIRIARLNSDGSLDTTFNPGSGANNIFNTIILQPDGKIVIGGQFTTFNGATRNRITRLNADGSLDTSFNTGSGTDSSVYAMVLQSDGKLIIGGDFSAFNGTAINRIARLNADGSLDTTFNTGVGANEAVLTATLQQDGNIIIGGDFVNYNGVVRHRIARIIGDTPLSTVDNAIQKLHYYPNPTKGMFHISSHTPINGVTITNLLGQKIKSFVFDSQEIDVNLEGLVAGIYIIDIASNGEHKSIKVIKE